MIPRSVFNVIVLLLAICLSASAKTATSARAKQVAAKARTTAKSSSYGRKATYRRPVPRRPSTPSGPSAERIRVLQQALIERGYLQAEATGVWNAQSVEALKKFEADQNWKADGKIDSRSLIALGLGPKYDENLSLPVPSGVGGTVVAADQANANEPQRN